MKGAAFGSLLYVDVRSLTRDPLLAWLFLSPIAIALLLRVLIPPLSTRLSAAAELDLAPFHPLIMGGFLMTAPGIVGMVVGFLMLDEKDTRTLTALRVTPLSMMRYGSYRIFLPLAVGVLTTMLAYPLVGVAPLPFRQLAPIALLGAFAAPLLALILASLAPNKVAGLAAVKVINGVNLLPIAAFFLPMPLQLWAGFIPTYWPMRALWSAVDGAPFGRWIIVGVIVNSAALLAVGRLFHRRTLRRA